jgi:N-methylhydantoinase A
MTHRLGVDVGGTFTDLLLINEETGATFASKCQQPRPTRPRRFGRNRARLRERGDQAVRTHRVDAQHDGNNQCRAGGKRHSRRAGHDRRLSPDSSGGELIRPGRSCGMDRLAQPEPLAALDDTVEVRERIGARGEVVRELDEASAQAARGRGRYCVADKCLREPRARTAHPRDRQRGSA